MRDLNLHLRTRTDQARILIAKGYGAIDLKATTGDQQTLL